LTSHSGAEALEMSRKIIVMCRGNMCKEYQRGAASGDGILCEAIGKVVIA
jgi:ABC-type sugar transport system ATPase subunit